jgi:hypothetical protein
VNIFENILGHESRAPLLHEKNRVQNLMLHSLEKCKIK